MGYWAKSFSASCSDRALPIMLLSWQLFFVDVYVSSLSSLYYAVVYVRVYAVRILKLGSLVRA